MLVLNMQLYIGVSPCHVSLMVIIHRLVWVCSRWSRVLCSPKHVLRQGCGFDSASVIVLFLSDNCKAL